MNISLFEADAKPKGKSDAGAYIYYTAFGYWPSWYTGYYLIGKRSAEGEAKSDGKSDADAYLYYTTYGYWPSLGIS